MCDGYILPLPGGDTVCIPIYVAVIHWPPEDPDPWPWRDLLQDVATLVTINQATARIRDERVRDQLTQMIQETVGTLAQQLPEGIRLGDEVLNIASD